MSFTVKSWLRETESVLGRKTAWAALGAAAVGLLAFASGLVGGHSPRTFGALIASWLFFAGAAAGALAFRAFFRIVDARWARPLARLGATQIQFAPLALGLLVLILVGAVLVPWLQPGHSAWLSPPFLVVRQLVLFAALFGFARFKLRDVPGEGRPAARPAVIYCLLFAVVLSIWAFDFVLGLDRSFQSTIIGPYLFMSAFMAGTGVVTLLAVRDGQLEESSRRDISAFMLAMVIFWGYLFWSQYLPMWYGNLPDEVRFGLHRAAGGRGIAVLAVVGLVFAVPFLTLLLHSRGRGSARVLTSLVVVQLVGLWLNCYLLVVPSLVRTSAPAFDPRDVLIALGMLGAFMLASARGLRAPAAATA